MRSNACSMAASVSPSSWPGVSLEDSHISLRLQTQRVSLVDRLEAFHAAVEGDGSRRLSVAVPVSQAGNHPGCPGEAEGGVRVFLLGGVAFQRRVERLQRG